MKDYRGIGGVTGGNGEFLDFTPQKYPPIRCKIGGSFRGKTVRLGGYYAAVGGRSDFNINKLPPKLMKG